MNKISIQLLIELKNQLCCKVLMNLIGNLFKSSSKNRPKDAKLNNQVHFFSPEKCVSQTKSQTLSQDKNWLQFSIDYSFYLQKIIEVKLGKTDIVPKTKSDKSHMVYQICVLTSDFEYKIKKRFSVFNEFYSHIKKQVEHLDIVFPKKTILVSGTNIDVVSERYELLNTFIAKIFLEVKQQKSKDLEFRFLSFLQIDDQYEKRKIKSFSELPRDPIEKFENMFGVEDTSIAFELRKLNDYNNHQKDILSRLQSYMNYKSYKLNNDEIKILLVGNISQNLRGLLNLSLSINNEIKALELLRFLLNYISPSKKSYNDKIYKQFEKLPIEAFHFEYQQIKNNFCIIEFKKLFFVILELYCQNKLFNQTKILQLYPQFLTQFELWKSLCKFNQGHHMPKKAATFSNLHLQDLLSKPAKIPQQKTKSFQITPKKCEFASDSLCSPIGTQNSNVFSTKSTLQDDKNKKLSFCSNDSTSELIIEEDWEICKMKLELAQSDQDIYKTIVIKNSEKFCLKSNKTNKLRIEILKTNKSVQQCQQLSKNWNKLIYDQRHDPFTGISRIYMKLNGKSKIFKYRQEDEKIEKNDEKLILISKKRVESYNSFAKVARENFEQTLKIKVNSPCNGFQEIITIQSVEIGVNKWDSQQNYRKVTIQLNFEGQEDYFKSELFGQTSALLQNAIKAFAE